MQHCGEVPREFFMHRLILLLSYHTVLWVSQSLSLSSTHFKEWYSSSSALDIYNLHSRTLPACSATSFPDGVSILVSCQVVLCRVWSKRVGVLIIWVLTAVIGSGLSSESYASIVICVYGFAKVDGILQLFLKHLLTGIPGQLEQKEACVGFWEEVIRRVVFIQDLDDKVSAPEVSNGPGQPCPAPHKAKKEGAFRVRERFHHFPEPLDQGCRRLNPFIRCHWL